MNSLCFLRIGSGLHGLVLVSVYQVVLRIYLDLFVNKYASFSGKSPVKLVFRTGKSAWNNWKYKDKEFIVYAEPVMDDTKKLIYVVSYAVDVSDLNQFMRNERLINNCMEHILQEKDAEKALVVVMREVCLHLKADRAILLKHDILAQTSSLAYEYATQGKQNLKEIFDNVKLNPNDPWYIRTLSKKGFSLPDIQNKENTKQVDEMMGSWSELIKNNFSSLYVTPIHTHGKLWGSFGLFYDIHPYKLKEHEQKILG